MARGCWPGDPVSGFARDTGTDSCCRHVCVYVNIHILPLNPESSLAICHKFSVCLIHTAASQMELGYPPASLPQSQACRPSQSCSSQPLRASHPMMVKNREDNSNEMLSYCSTVPNGRANAKALLTRQGWRHSDNRTSIPSSFLFKAVLEIPPITLSLRSKSAVHWESSLFQISETKVNSWAESPVNSIVPRPSLPSPPPQASLPQLFFLSPDSHHRCLVSIEPQKPKLKKILRDFPLHTNPKGKMLPNSNP